MTTLRVIQGGKGGHADMLKPWELLRSQLQGSIAELDRQKGERFAETEKRFLQAYMDLVETHGHRAANRLLRLLQDGSIQLKE